MSVSATREVPLIYNLFPSLVGEVGKWRNHVGRAVDLGFNWLFLNPIHLTGASGSLYSIRDYFKLSPVFFPQDSDEAQWAAFSQFVEHCRSEKIEVMVDLVINHTAYDNPLTKTHRHWYKIDDSGNIKNPGAADDSAPGGYVVWGDLSEIDNENSSDRNNLYDYWWRLVEKFLDCGVRGFRCDAAYQVPTDLWRMLIERSKKRTPEARFFAESLGCPIDDTIALSNAGFDFVFNSAKWWDYHSDWFPKQLEQLHGRARSIAFPESHDTERLASEYNGDINRVKQHFLFTTLITSGSLITLGFEYGFRKKPHVVHSNPFDYEGASYDLTDFIRDINTMKKTNPVFQEDNRVERIDSGNGDVLALKKTTLDGKESVLMLFNLCGGDQEVDLGNILNKVGAPALEEQGKRRMRLHSWGASIIKIS
ncbi:MAG: alpha-amylase [Planctomycetes bacterium]|nr:alpha-amylase [Planctomycetota bacterium]